MVRRCSSGKHRDEWLDRSSRQRAIGSTFVEGNPHISHDKALAPFVLDAVLMRWILMIVVVSAWGDGNTNRTGSTCGDGVVDPGEDCDGDVGDETCASQGFTAGTLACSDSCTLDVTACTTCGDNARAGAEACDGTDLAG